MLFDADGASVNEKFVRNGAAVEVTSLQQAPLCLTYPSFNMLEKLVIYPTYGERCWAKERFGIDLNQFEENHIAAVTNTFAFEKALIDVLRREEFSNIKAFFMKLREN